VALNKFIKNNVITYKRRSNINLFISYTRKIFNLKCDWENHIFTISLLKIELLRDYNSLGGMSIVKG